MDEATRLRRILDDPRRLFGDDDLPPNTNLPWWLAPLPKWLENFGLNVAWLVVAINLVGTAFGFWYYGIHPFSDPVVQLQFATEPLVMWPFVPDSPVATLFIALSLALWKLGRSNEYVNALAFFGCWKLGLWTPFVLAAFADSFLAVTWFPMYLFLFFSHLAMVVQAFLIQRYSAFPIRAVAVAVAWYGFNDLVDYFVPLVGDPHHTALPVADSAAAYGTTVLQVAAAGAVFLTLFATFLALATRVKKLELGGLAGTV
ncbi:DUF1405 domain-containing protein [Haloferax larsenii]|uniref:DUF1405 domain-containing protein n=1 Tax=Haloferax larsenii TaxID=302484 RepID=A0ABY5RHI8_HALLR|nr:DUF1405 domain-containing protein [Haloferax larsenii]UVE50615.1 DUF1405 domain-containing protein [Haloferax larsenii]